MFSILVCFHLLHLFHLNSQFFLSPLFPFFFFLICFSNKCFSFLSALCYLLFVFKPLISTLCYFLPGFFIRMLLCPSSIPISSRSQVLFIFLSLILILILSPNFLSQYSLYVCLISKIRFLPFIKTTKMKNKI